MGLIYPKPTDLSHLSASNNGGVGLVAAYNFQPSPDGVLVDISGEGHEGTITGAVSSKDGMRFNGSSDYVDFSTSLIETFSYANPFTFIFKIKFNDVTTEGTIISSNKASTDRFSFQNSGGELRVGFYDGSIRNSVSGAIVNNQWHSVVFINHVSMSKMYIDGIEVNGVSAWVHSKASQGTILGAIAGQDLYKLNGILADAKIYNYPWSAEEAVQYHNSFQKLEKRGNFSDHPVGSTI